MARTKVATLPPIGGDPEDILSYVHRLADRAHEQRRPWERQVEENVRNLAGRQFDQWVEELGQYVDLSDVFVPNDERWRKAPVFNWLSQQWYILALAKLTENVPVLGAMPRTADHMDAQLAAIWDSIWKYEWHQMSMPELLFQHYGWVLTAGESVLKLWWDPRRGDLADFYGPETFPLEGGNPLTESPYVAGELGMGEEAEPNDADDVESDMAGEDDEYGNAMPRRERLGDLACQVVSPTSVLWPFGPEPYWQKPWVLHEYLLGVDEIEERFGVEVDGEPMQAEADNLLMKMEYSSFYGNSGSPEARSGIQNDPMSVAAEDKAFVREIWFRECAKYPFGRLLIVTRSKVLYDDINPFVVPGEREKVIVPFFRFDRPGFPFRQEGLSDLEALIPVARARNRALAGLLDFVEHNEQPIKFVNRMMVADDQLGSLNVPGGVVEVDGDVRAAAAYLNTPQLPIGGKEISGLLMQELMTLGHSNVGGSGNAVTNDASGELQREVRFDADRPWGATLRKHSWEWARFGQAMLDILAVCMEDQRMLAIAGDDQTLNFVQVRPDLFRGAIDVYPLPESAVLETRQDKQNRITQLLMTATQLAAGDPTGRMASQYFKTMGYPDLHRAMTLGGEARALAQRQIAEMMQTAQLPPILPEQDHGAHVEAVTEFMQTLTYRDLAPEVQAVLRAYKYLHEQAGAVEALRTMQQQTQVQAAGQQMAMANMAPVAMQQAQMQGAMQQEVMGDGPPRRGPERAPASE